MPTHDPLQPPDQIDAARFAEHMAAVQRCFNVLPLSDAIDMLDEGRLPKRALCITFDDGYEDNHSVAWPILRRHGLSATFFICTGYLGQGLMFNDVVTEAIRRASGDTLDLSWLGWGLRSLASPADRQALSRELIQFVKYQSAEVRQDIGERLWHACAPGAVHPQLMMSPEQVQDLARHGMAIGGHTHSHPILTNITLDEAREDIIRNREAIAELTGHPAKLFAYPNGRPGKDYDQTHARLLEGLGFRGAVTTAWGVATRQIDRFQIPRFSPWNVSGTKLALQLLKNAQTGRHPVTV